MNGSEKCKESLNFLKKFYSSSTDKKWLIKIMSMFLWFETDLKWKRRNSITSFYLKCDVLLLADVFQSFRNGSLKNDGLYFSHYLSAPVKIQYLICQKQSLNLFQILTCILFTEKSMRGGVSKTYSKANNKYLKYYDPKQ